MFQPNDKTQSDAGFSLVEVLVALAIFTIVITTVNGALVVLINANSKSNHTQEVITNLMFALDGMTRRVRTGFGYHCIPPTSSNKFNHPTNGGSLKATSTQDCLGGLSLSFVDTEGALGDKGYEKRLVYSFDKDYHTKPDHDPDRGAIIVREFIKPSDNSDEINDLLGDPYPITSEQVDITNAFFTVRNSDHDDTDHLQPSVTFVLEGEIIFKGSTTSLQLQSTVAQRVLDI